MKFQLLFKTPDVLDRALKEHMDAHKEIKRVAEKFIQYGEYITIEFDTDKGTAEVECV